MYVETRGEAGRKEHELGTKLMDILDDIGIKMSRSEAFIAICDDICSSERLVYDYFTVIDIWKALHMDKNEAYEWLKKSSNEYHRDNVVRAWEKYMKEVKNYEKSSAENISSLKKPGE